MKKVLSVFLSILLIVAILPLGAFNLTASALTEGYYTYTVENGKATITAVDTEIYGNVTVPSTLGGYTVTTIEYAAFWGCSELTGITIPNCVTYIEAEAFDGCTNLRSVKLPNGITSIQYSTFYGCYSLESITIPDSVTSIGYSAFGYCESLQNIYLSDSLTTIDEGAFYFCCSLEYITIPQNVSFIAQSAFQYCNNMISVDVSRYNQHYSSINGVLFNKEKTHLIFYPRAKTTPSCTIPNTVTTICESAFEDCYYLESVTIPESVVSIESHAFAWCGALESIYIPSSVQKIGELAFYDCYCLSEISVSASNKYYSSSNGVLFNKAKTSLICYPTAKIDEKYTIPNGVVIIVDHAFVDAWLESVTIPSSVKEIGDMAFYGCSYLYNISLPDSITYIGSDVFTDTDYYYTDSNWTNGVLYIGKHLIDADSEWFLGDYTVKSNTKTIASYAFYDCAGLTSVTIPNSVVTLGENAFCCCENLMSISLGTGLTSIKQGTFSYCYSLEGISIPNSVKSIGENAFDSCENLKTATLGTGVETIGDSAFECCYILENISIPNSVKSIGENAFVYCENLKTATLGTGVETIGDSAFECCYSLESISIPNSVKVIGNNAFVSCESLMTVTMANSVEEIGEFVFAYCTNLKNITLSNNISEIKEGAFAFCAGLESINIPNSAQFIDMTAFWGCLNLEKFEISKNHQYFSKIDEVLYNDDLTGVVAIPGAVTKVVIEPTVEEVDVWNFITGYFSSLTEVVILGDETELTVFDYLELEDLTFAHIYCPKGSAAETGAKGLGIECTTFSNLPMANESQNASVNIVANETANISNGATVYVETSVLAENQILYNLSIKKGTTTLQPNEEVAVIFENVTGFNLQRCKVYQVANDGTKKEIETQYKNGKLIIKTQNVGKYLIEQLPFEPGDINDSGDVTLDDVVTLAQIVAGWQNVDHNEAALDVNGDGDTTLDDVVLLAQFVAGWDVTLS